MKSIITLKTDKEVKKNAQKLASNLGLSLSAVVNASLRQFIRDQGVHFSKIPIMKPELERIIGKAEKDLKAGKNISPIFKNGKDLIAHLNS
jgi:addiction module RelB/DinJ family antitoxin